MLSKIIAAILRWYYRLLNNRAWKSSRGAIASNNVSTLQVDTDQGQIELRMYANSQGASRPLIVYFHGGGWVIGDLDTHHPFCQQLCLRSGCTVVSVDYRLAPEHRFPAAHDDCLAATAWIGEKLNELGPNNGSLVLAGDSAGANLASCTCAQLGESTRTPIVGDIMIYPVTDHYTQPYDSYVEKGRGYALTSNLMRWFWDTYMGKPSKDNSQRALPIRATNLGSLPPTLLVTAENDPLRDEGIAYGEKLRRAKVPVQHHHFENDAHGFACSEGITESFELLMTELCAWLDQLSCTTQERNTTRR